MLVTPLARAWAYTLREWVQWSDSGPLREFLERGEPLILCVWHQDFLPTVAYLLTQWVQQCRTELTVLVDAEWADTRRVAAARALGLHVLTRASDQEPGADAKRLAAECAARQSSVVLAADGARGAVFHAQWLGPRVARDTGFPLIALRTAHLYGLELRDPRGRHRLPPIPGRGRAHTASSEPLCIPPEAGPPELAAYREELERRLNALIPVADAYLTGVVPPTILPTAS